MIKHKAKKSLGQNFLRDRVILKKIADFAQIEKTDVVVEVGPGEGTLTEILLTKASKIIAIEKDENLAKKLENKFSQEIASNRLQIIVGDVLKVSKGVFEMPRSQKTPLDTYKLVGNIPYYITGTLFKKALESANPPKSITFVVQKEVAERIMARDRKTQPSHKATAGKESILSISIKAYGEPKYGGIIKAGSFFPKPKVDSAIISIRNISKDRFKITFPTTLTSKKERNEGISEKRFFEILKAGFAHKRKLLLSNLAGVSRFNLDTLRLGESFGKCGISEKARAEDLRVEDWFNLVKEILKD